MNMRDFDMEFFFMFILAMGVVMVFLWIIVFALRSHEKAKNNSQPVKTNTAKLIDMQQVPAGQIVIGEIWVMFELDNGERIRLKANPKNSLVVGDKGILTWQGTNILKFERNK